MIVAYAADVVFLAWIPFDTRSVSRRFVPDLLSMGDRRSRRYMAKGKQPNYGLSDPVRGPGKWH